MKPGQRPDTTGRRINDAYADLVTLKRKAERRQFMEARAGTMGPASQVRRISPAQYEAEQRAKRDAAISADFHQQQQEKPAPQANNSKSHNPK